MSISTVFDLSYFIPGVNPDLKPKNVVKDAATQIKEKYNILYIYVKFR